MSQSNVPPMPGPSRPGPGQPGPGQPGPGAGPPSPQQPSHQPPYGTPGPPPQGYPAAGNFPPGQAHPGPSLGAPSPAGFAPLRPVRPPRNWGRTWLIALILALIGVAGAGSGAYALAIATGDSGYGPVGCGDGSSSRCLRAVDGEALLATFKDRGFTCQAGESDSDYHDCVLRLGNTEYKATVSVREDMVEDLAVSVDHNPDLELSQQSMGFLVWSMILPFAKDPAAADVSKEWLARQLSGGGEQKVKIRGYPYSFRSLDQGRFVEVRIEGGYDY